MSLLIDRIAEGLNQRGQANISFQGGEPLLAGISYFQSFKRYPNIQVHYSIQTNATLLTEEFAKLFKENHFLVGISLDGYQTNMDAYRYDVKKQGVYYQVLKGIDYLNQYQVSYNILTYSNITYLITCNMYNSFLAFQNSMKERMRFH